MLFLQRRHSSRAPPRPTPHSARRRPPRSCRSPRSALARPASPHRPSTTPSTTGSRHPRTAGIPSMSSPQTPSLGAHAWQSSPRATRQRRSSKDGRSMDIRYAIRAVTTVGSRPRRSTSKQARRGCSPSAETRPTMPARQHCTSHGSVARSWTERSCSPSAQTHSPSQHVSPRFHTPGRATGTTVTAWAMHRGSRSCHPRPVPTASVSAALPDIKLH